MKTPAELYRGDCLEQMARIPDGSIDLIACDLPYGTTQCKWDSVIPFAPLWAHYKRVISGGGVIVLTACQPFTSALVMSNPTWFKFDDVWDKRSPVGFLNAKKMPLRRHESVLVFSPAKLGRFTYKPAMRKGVWRDKGTKGRQTSVYGHFNRPPMANDDYYPTSIIDIPKSNFQGTIHPTQKPVALFEYLIRTYTHEGETVLDNCFGSGTTGVAAINTGRRFVGIERDPEYFTVGKARVAAAVKARREAGEALQI